MEARPNGLKARRSSAPNSDDSNGFTSENKTVITRAVYQAFGELNSARCATKLRPNSATVDGGSNHVDARQNEVTARNPAALIPTDYSVNCDSSNGLFSVYYCLETLF